jgi:DNA-binding NarL/FixJ family response regulator
MRKSPKVTVVLADDHLIVREGIRSTLRKFRFLRVVGEARDGIEALEQAAALSPDVVLMDINMPRMNGLEATARMRERFPRTKILVVTVHDSRQYIAQILRAGAHGYVLKDTSPDELARAIQAVADGNSFLSPRVAREVVYEVVGDVEPGNNRPALTEREQQILKLLGGGKTSKEIATALSLSVRSIETFRLRLMRKLNVRNAPELVRYAAEHELFS